MWDYTFVKGGKPRYLQIADALEKDIISGGLQPGHRLLTHRELAQVAGVTVSTATRAYAEVEKRGLIKTMVGRGTFVTATPETSVHDGAWPVIELGVPMPLVSEEPNVRPILQKLMAEEDVDALVKCFSPFGYARHRDIAAGWVRRFGVRATADSLVITAGHQHGLYSIFYALFSLGDRIAVGRLTTPGMIALAQQAGFVLKGVTMDADGMIPEELDALCGKNNIKGVYIAGNSQNPSAKPMSPERAEALAKVVERHNVTLVEDNSFIWREPGEGGSIAALVPENSVFLSSFSMALYSGLRVAFVHASQKFYNRLAQIVVENIWTVAPLCVAVACECIVSGAVDKTLKLKRQELARRVELLRKKFYGFDVSCCERSIHAWIRLPEGWHSRDFEHMAEKSGVRVLAADKISVDGDASPYVRLALTGPPDIASFKKGLDILLSLLKKETGIVNPLW